MTGMRLKKTIIRSSATLVGLYLILFALRSTVVGYMMVALLGVEYFSEPLCARQNPGKEGDVPDLFSMDVAQEHRPDAVGTHS